MPQKTREQLQAERFSEIEAIQQMQARRDAERAERQRQQDEFAAQVQAQRDAREAFVRRRWMQMEDRPMTQSEIAAVQMQISQEWLALHPPPTIPSLEELHQAKHAEEKAAAEEAERQRIAAIPLAQLRRSTLPWQEQQRRAKWEQINSRPWPWEE